MKFRWLPLYLLFGIIMFLNLRAGQTAVSPQTVQADEAPAIYLPFITRPTEDPEWLKYLNRFRDLVGLAHLSEESSWSAGAELHSRYMVKNDDIGHSEDPSNPWYTPEGHAAAQNGNVAVSSSSSAPDTFAIDLWMTGPFHAIGVVDPRLQLTGFGSYRENVGEWQMGATLDVLRGRGPLPGDISYPIYFPGDGSAYWLTQYGGKEFPDPLQSCPGYSAPSGPPVIIQLGSGGVTPNVTASSFSRSGVMLDHCVFDETNYATSLGRTILNSRDAVVIMPREPLAVGEAYTASITHNGVVYTWSFTVINRPTAVLPLEADSLYEIR